MRESCVSDTDVHGATPYAKCSVVVGLSIAQIRTGVVHVLRENGSRLLRLRVLRFARNDSRSRARVTVGLDSAVSTDLRLQLNQMPMRFSQKRSLQFGRSENMNN